MPTLTIHRNEIWRAWVSRFLIAIVLFWNLQCSVLFMAKPLEFINAFQLTGIPGKVTIIGFGILFLMWQVPYVFALINPIRFHISLFEAVIMQTIGAIAETVLLMTITNEFSSLRSSIMRFILFDSAGLVLLLSALILVHPLVKSQNKYIK